MLSAVENFGSAAAAASHASYAHHNPFAIAAAAAAAGPAAAAAVMPSHQSAALEHHHHMLSHSSLGSAGLLMPSAQLTALPSSEGTTRNLQSSQLPITNKLNNNSIAAPVAVAMSSAEFVRPHPKQPRYSSSSNNNNNNNNNHNNNNNTSSNTNSSSNNNNNNNNGSSNGIPLHLRSNKVGNSCLSNTPSLRTKYSTEQAGPVNLVTSNNNNINNNGSSSNIKSTSSPPIKSPSLESIPQAPSEREIMAGMYAQKLSYASNVSNEVAAAYHQYSRMYPPNRSIYGEPSLYAAHHQLARSQLHSRPTYLTDQFPGYLHPSPGVYSPAEPPSTLLRHQPPQQSTQQQQQQQHSLGSHNASNLLNNSHNNSTNINNTSLCTTQLPVMSDRHPHSSSSLHHSNSNNNNHHLPQPPSLVGLDRQQQQQQQILSSHTKDKDAKNLVCLNGKVPANSAGFKVPSGKEGSLKHRILTRPPYGEKDIGRHRSSIAATVVRNSTNNNSPTNFTKGSLIELSTGELRRVEDMRTEDFVQSAERSVHLELADSTVVKIANIPHSVMITFSYNKNRSKVDIDASIDHPFFVYGQGWASCNPELTLKTFGLKCQRLQVGDVCISLKPRESSSYSSKPQSPTTYTQPVVQHYKDEMAPQNLSRKSSSLSSLASTIPTTATATAVSSRLSVPMPQHLPPPTSIMSHLPVQSYEMLQSYGTSPSASSHQLHHLSSNVVSHPQHHHHHHHHHPPHHMQRQSKADDRFIVTRNNGDCQASPSPPAISTSRPPSNQPYYLGTMVDKRSTNGGRGSNNSAESNHSAASDHQAAIDASSSRKRRWSWSDPVNNCDEDGPPTHKTICNSNS